MLRIRKGRNGVRMPSEELTFAEKKIEDEANEVWQ
jgi:hypothetical protein